MNWKEPPPLDSSSILPGVHPIVANALIRRGISTPEAALAFQNPNNYIACPAADLPGISSAVDRLEMAIRKSQSICVWGDFDVDGQTATTILFQALQALKADVAYHIPVRVNEGHGVNLAHLQEVIASGASLILTCDTGITAHPAVDYARSRGVDMIITDHHDLPASLPQAIAIANPKLLPEGHPLSTLSGAGVAYKLAEELYCRFGLAGEAAQYLDLASLGLVADLARLTGDARYLVQLGLETLRNTKRLGLQIMMETADLVPANINEEHIGFVLGPRLNALGRLADANPAVELLTTADPVRARVLTTQIEGLNMQRQLFCNQVTQAAEAHLRADPSLLSQPVLVLGHPSWPGGVVGIVASRLVDHYGKPVILFSTPPGEPAHGSARSIGGLNITAAIASQKDLLLNFGGHPMAAGLSLDPEKLPEFSRRLEKTVAGMLNQVETEHELEIDAWLDLPEISLDLAKALESLAPYGPGNDKLVLATHALKLQSVTTIGRNKEHLKLLVEDGAGNSRSVLWWNGAEEKETIPEGRFDLAYNLRASDWHGSLQVQMEYVDLHALEVQKLEVNIRRYEIVDYRNILEPSQMLADLKGQPSIMLWVEGKEKKAFGGQDRNELEAANELVIWTIPPSPDELRAALEKVQPRTVYLFASTDAIELPENFLGQLAGLIKYAINHRGGKISYSELEAATAQRSLTVRKGVDWLVSEGKIELKGRENELIVCAGSSSKDRLQASRLWAEIQSLMAECTAYRAYFKRADKNAIFETI